MYNGETNQILEFLGMAEAIFAFSMIIISILASVVSTIITGKRYGKEKRRELFFEHQIKAYQEYLNDIFRLIKLMRMDKTTFQTMDNNEEIRDFIGVKLMKSQADAMIFSSNVLYILLSKCDNVISKLVVAKDVTEYLSLFRELNSIIDEIMKSIRREISIIKK